MARKYPIGLQSFQKIREDGFVYVDKTLLIYLLIESGSYYLLSRPRRFGKSLLLDTIADYLMGAKRFSKGFGSMINGIGIVKVLLSEFHSQILV